MPSVVTANNLRSGAVVYLGCDATWVLELSMAAVANDAMALKTLEVQALRAVERTDVTAVYAMDVRVIDGHIAPVSVRERIRANRPTTA
jgi:Protein of unknown function (DUF2849)